MKLDDFKPADHEILEVRGPHEVVAHLGDDRVRKDRAIRFENGEIGRVVEALGQERALVQVFDSKTMREGQSVEVLDDVVRLPKPAPGDHPVGGMSFVSDGLGWSLELPDLSSFKSPTALATGVELGDIMAPLARGGVNLLVRSTSQSLIPEMIERCADGTVVLGVGLGPQEQAPAMYNLSFETNWEHLMAFRIATRWAWELARQTGEVLVVGRLPGLDPTEHQGVGDPGGTTVASFVNEVTASLASTDDATITTILEVDVSRSGAALVADTLGFGDVDAQWFVNADADFIHHRSSSRVQLEPEKERQRQRWFRAFNDAQKAQERADLFGEGEWSDAEREAIRERDSLLEMANVLDA